MDRGEVPYLRIVGELRRRIAAGELAVGDRIPSTRQIMRDWGVAMATASKVIGALRDEGLVRPVPGIGTVVVYRVDTLPEAADDSGGLESAPADLTEQRVLGVAIKVADSEGLAAASMDRLATELGTPVLSLHRHVRNRDELVHLMADAAYGEIPLPAQPPPGWRAQLEVSLRLQWRLHRRHPWLSQAIPLTRPEFVRNAMAHTEWVLRALDGLGLTPNAMLHASVSLAGFVRGVAAAPEADDEGLAAVREGQLAEALSSGGFPTMARVIVQSGLDLDLDSLFEFGLRRQLDGLAVLVAGAAHGRRD
ncbi:TetR/AcrR family transcriptional regulator C-terminal domain-containing protein [Nonomuraea sp. CA-143628]|uniref:TetR/AcrR family transcriptional regulator C-terminal domain-containing protein n=1 Tax=Nonomuraea sp. CA-143628 TaxID=3239997 RepID=UPI003D8D258F